MKIVCAGLFLAGLSANSAASPAFTVSIDQEFWAKWGLCYPATYVFQVEGFTPEACVAHRDAGTQWWSRIPEYTPDEFFNGVETVRFDRTTGKAYVSVGFHGRSAMEIEFRGVASAKFESIAPYYDGRRSAYTLSIDNWGRSPGAHPNGPWKGEASDESDNYQAALHVCRSFHLPVSIAINTHMAGGHDFWRHMQDELNLGDDSWEPAVHAQTHPCSAAAYGMRGYRTEILGCREEILKRLHGFPYGGRVFEHILTCGYTDDNILREDAGEFLFVRGWNAGDNPESVTWATWQAQGGFYGVGGLSTIAYDRVLERRTPKARFHAADVAELNDVFDRAARAGGIFYAMWHPDRYSNSVIYDRRPPVGAQQGSTLVQHFSHVANRKDIWYVANGWMYSYRYVAEHARVKAERE